MQQFDPMTPSMLRGAQIDENNQHLCVKVPSFPPFIHSCYVSVFISFWRSLDKTNYEVRANKMDQTSLDRKTLITSPSTVNRAWAYPDLTQFCWCHENSSGGAVATFPPEPRVYPVNFSSESTTSRRVRCQRHLPMIMAQALRSPISFFKVTLSLAEDCGSCSLLSLSPITPACWTVFVSVSARFS